MNRWTEYVKEFARKNNLSYGCALSMPECKKGYREKYGDKVKQNVNKFSDFNVGDEVLYFEKLAKVVKKTSSTLTLKYDKLKMNGDVGEYERTFDGEKIQLKDSLGLEKLPNNFNYKYGDNTPSPIDKSFEKIDVAEPPSKVVEKKVFQKLDVAEPPKEVKKKLTIEKKEPEDKRTEKAIKEFNEYYKLNLASVPNNSYKRADYKVFANKMRDKYKLRDNWEMYVEHLIKGETPNAPDKYANELTPKQIREQKEKEKYELKRKEIQDLKRFELVKKFYEKDNGVKLGKIKYNKKNYSISPEWIRVGGDQLKILYDYDEYVNNKVRMIVGSILETSDGEDITLFDTSIIGRVR